LTERKFMGSRQQIQDIPNALRATLEKARTEYAAAVRQVRWGDGPVYVSGTGICAALGMAASYAFEALPGWPVVARPVEVFETSARSLLRPRSVLVMIAAPGEWPEALELLRVARKHGSTLVVLTNSPDSPLANTADQVLLIRAEGEADLPAVTVCLHAALNFLALAAARLLKRHEPQWESLERDFERLPDQIDWVLTQLPVAVRSMAAELGGFQRLRIVGGGFYHFAAWRAARRLRALAGISAEGVEAAEFSSELAGLRRDEAVLFLAGSRSKIRKLTCRAASEARVRGARVLSITDSQDRDLVEQSDLGVLIPALMEAAGCTLSLALVEWLAVEAARAAKQPAAPARPSQRFHALGPTDSKPKA
jgi:glucosamine--fructose-6-phosphate aminotransferase (isomerizing)